MCCCSLRAKVDTADFRSLGSLPTASWVAEVTPTPKAECSRISCSLKSSTQMSHCGGARTLLRCQTGSHGECQGQGGERMKEWWSAILLISMVG